MTCPTCKGQYVVIRLKPVAAYGGRLTRFAFPCPTCCGTGKVEVELNSRLLAASGDDTGKEMR